ncbi:hypothetical protein G6F62_006517 [Rhizopus arrhizus]|nr:hypothetical protein G6F62_006517 [Rhizopus arrhizus]KAG1383248.1 hypothetical protein G6F61_001534 [Rhizopus arrhizus]
MISNSFIFGYFLGGITFIPLVIIIAYIIHFITRHFTFTPIINTIANQDQIITNQSYKIGWLQVHKNKIIKETSSIGDRVVSYISRNNSQIDNHLYYSVLKHNILYLYDSEKQLDCKQVINLTNHKVSIHPPGLTDAELFSKPQHIKIENRDNTITYYINCDRCIDKEDWYFTLIRASSNSTSPDKTHFDQPAMNHLINIVHSDEYQFQTQWFNALLGRLFLSVYKTQDIQQALYKKVVSKLDKINAKRPSFLGEITVRSVDAGHSIPRITQPKLLGISASGELSAEAHLHYDGCVRIEIETVLEWKYSDLLPPFTVDIILAITLEEIEGKVLCKVKEHPTNRLWYAFQDQPKIKWKLEPVVWEKRVGYSVVVKAIETKIQEFIAETMILPNFDDIVFFSTSGMGGIFEESENRSVKENEREEEKKQDEHLLVTARSLPELLQQQLSSTESWSSSSDEEECMSLCSTSPTSTLLDEPQFDIQRKETTVRLRKSSSLAALLNSKSSASIAINVSPATAHKEKKDSIDQKSI